MGKEIITVPNTVSVSNTSLAVTLDSVPTHAVTIDSTVNTVKVTSHNGSNNIPVSVQGTLTTSVSNFPTDYIKTQQVLSECTFVTLASAGTGVPVLAGISNKKISIWAITISWINAPSNNTTIQFAYDTQVSPFVVPTSDRIIWHTRLTTANGQGERQFILPQPRLIPYINTGLYAYIPSGQPAPSGSTAVTVIYSTEV